ncbi:MAG: hypothetical protein ABSE62_16005 [Chthoniobacteraceae bacterium]|jgi:hypothetical protein
MKPNGKSHSGSLLCLAIWACAISTANCQEPTWINGTVGVAGSPNRSVTTDWIAATANGLPVIYANTLPGINLNSNLWAGGGTDDRATLQTALNSLAAEGGGTLVLPTCSLISGSLALSSNERIVGLNEGTCGLFLSNSSDTPLLTNMHRSYIQGSDENIRVENLTLNGNGQYPQGQFNQSHDDSNGNFVCAVDFNGVNNVAVCDVQTIDSRCYGFDFTSCNCVHADDLIGYWHFPNSNNDTVHLDAPYNDVSINDIWGNGLDDEIAINGDEDYTGGAEPAGALIDTGSASSRHVRVNNIFSAEANSAIRLISLVAPANDIVIRNVTGTVRQYGILIDTAGRSGFPGNFGCITISGVDLAFAGLWNGAGYPYQDMIGVADKVDDLKLEEMTVLNYCTYPGFDSWYGPWLYLGGGAKVGSLEVNGSWQDDSFAAMSETIGRIMVDGASVQNFIIGPLQWSKPSGSETGGILLSMDAGSLDDLTLIDVTTNNGAAIVKQTGGSIGTIREVDLNDLDADGPSIVLSGSGTQVPVQTPYQAWQGEMFSASQLANPAISGDTATPAGDGIPNLMKYALNLNPWTNCVRRLPVASIATTGSGNYLTLTYTQVITATDITYTPEISTDLLTWNSGAGFTTTPSVTNNPDGVTQTVTVQAAAPMGGNTPGQYMELRVTGP